MPDDTTFTTAVFAFLIDPFNQPFDAENLLVTRDDLAGLLVEQGEETSHLQQPGWGQ